MRLWMMLFAPLLLAQTAPPPAPDTVPVASVNVVARYPHDPTAFTQGLSWCDGALYESTGHVGRSDIRRVDLTSGEIRARTPIPADLFGEGSACWKDALYSVTWTTGDAFRWDRGTLRRTGRFTYAGQGWGLTFNDRHLVLSDGTDRLRFIDPERFVERGAVRVTLNGRPLKRLNELEHVEGEIFANIWMTGFIARIDPASGKVIGLIDLSSLVAEVGLTDPNAVANGIAYDPRANRLFVTGKNWPTLFEITIGPEIGTVP